LLLPGSWVWYKRRVHLPVLRHAPVLLLLLGCLPTIKPSTKLRAMPCTIASLWSYCCGGCGRLTLLELKFSTYSIASRVLPTLLLVQVPTLEQRHLLLLTA
jgi:hypothetical protein